MPVMNCTNGWTRRAARIGSSIPLKLTFGRQNWGMGYFMSFIFSKFLFSILDPLPMLGMVMTSRRRAHQRWRGRPLLNRLMLGTMMRPNRVPQSSGALTNEEKRRKLEVTWNKRICSLFEWIGLLFGLAAFDPYLLCFCLDWINNFVPFFVVKSKNGILP